MMNKIITRTVVEQGEVVHMAVGKNCHLLPHIAVGPRCNMSDPGAGCTSRLLSIGGWTIRTSTHRCC